MSPLDLLLLATEEGVPGTHIAADVVPLVGVIFLCGSVYLLLWSNYGAKKGALIYGVAFFGVGAMIGIFWWFGAPGTPVATGLTYFPGQANDVYVPKWFPMEPGSERAEFFEVTNSLENFQTPAEAVGMAGASDEELEADDQYANLNGALVQAVDRMIAVFFPTAENGAPLIGANRRAEIMQAAQEAMGDTSVVPEGYVQGDPFLSARAEPRGENSDQPLVFVTEENGLRVAGANLQVIATFVNGDPNAAPDPVEVVVEQGTFYAFQDPGALWFPSAIWTLVMAIAFGLCLFGLDRVESREKRVLREREPVTA